MVGSVTLGLLVSGLTPAGATPATVPTTSVVVSESLQPVLFAEATSRGTGSGARDHSMRFFARTVGSSSWNLLNASPTSGLTGTARVGAGLSIGQSFEYQVEHCDNSGCITSPVKTGQVSPELGAGPRPGASGLPFALGDALSAQVDVGSGNLMVQAAGIDLPRVSGGLGVGAVYNSLPLAGLGDSSAPGSQSAFFTSPMAAGWRLSTGSGVYLRAEPRTGAVVFYGPGGATGAFFPNGATAYTAPPGFTMDLTKTASPAGWSLFDHDSAQTWLFDTSGLLTGLRDRNGNTTTFAYTYTPGAYANSALTGITTDQGSTAARTLTVNRSGATITGLTQTAPQGSGLTSRSVTYAYNGGRLTGITDTLGRTTTLAYTGNFLTSVAAPGGIVTDFAYDGSTGRVTSVSQPTATTGTRAVTRIDYPDAATMRVAEPNTDQAQGIGAVPRTTYTLTGDGQKLVASVTDPTGAARSTTYTPFLDVASATDPAGTTTGDFDANSGESITGLTGASGATAGYSYDGSDPMTRYQPTGSTDGQGNASVHTYNGAGNRTSSANASSATAAVAYNADGTVSAATSVNGSVTTYGYNADKQLTSITPPAGTTLSARAYTFDAFGRVRTYTSGRGVTETYTYDAADRLTTTAYTGTGSAGGNVTYAYNTPGWMTSRVDPSGTTTYAYDPLGRLASRTHSINNIAVAYSYDRTGNVATETTTVPSVAGKTTTYAYDTRNLVTRMTLANGQVIDFAYDSTGRRTDTWSGTNAARTSWDAHTTTAYNEAGQVARVWTAKASNDADRVSDLTYDYASPGSSADTAAGGCATAPAAGTVTDLRWAMTDNVTGQTTAYCYDTQNRLVSAVAPTVGATAAVDFHYTYDANGNRLELRENGQVTQTQTVNAADQLTMAGYTHDAAGNTTATPDLGAMTYGRDEQMRGRTFTSDTGATANVSYVYADTNQVELLRIAGAGQSRTYSYGRTDANGLPQIATVTNSGSAPAADNTGYIAHDPVGTPIAFTAWTGQTHFYAEDGLGSTVALINQSGAYTADYNYDPNGEVTVTNPNGGSQILQYSPFRYAGGTYDHSSNLILFGQRWYDPTTGRFTQQDSIETIGNPTHSNRYEYAASNPTNFVDPTGQYPGLGTSPSQGPANTCSAARTCRPGGLAPASGSRTTPAQRRAGNCAAAALTGAIGGAALGGGVPGAVGGAALGCAGVLLQQ